MLQQVGDSAYRHLAKLFTGMAEVAKKFAQKADYWQKKCTCQAAADVSSSTGPVPKRSRLEGESSSAASDEHQFRRKTASVFDPSDEDGGPGFRYVNEMGPFYHGDRVREEVLPPPQPEEAGSSRSRGRGRQERARARGRQSRGRDRQ